MELVYKQDVEWSSLGPVKFPYCERLNKVCIPILHFLLCCIYNQTILFLPKQHLNMHGISFFSFFFKPLPCLCLSAVRGTYFIDISFIILQRGRACRIAHAYGKHLFVRCVARQVSHWRHIDCYTEQGWGDGEFWNSNGCLSRMPPVCLSFPSPGIVIPPLTSFPIFSEDVNIPFLALRVPPSHWIYHTHAITHSSSHNILSLVHQINFPGGQPDPSLFS